MLKKLSCYGHLNKIIFNIPAYKEITNRLIFC
jgi:hypothetical protein